MEASCVVPAVLGAAHPRGREVESKANELMRRSMAKLRRGVLGAGDCCRAAACVELACASLRVCFDRARLVRVSGAKEKVYSSTLFAIQNVLGIRRTADARSLAVRFGCLRCVRSAAAILEAYKARFVRELKSDEERQKADFGGNVFAAAALYIAGRKMKVKIDRRDIAREAGVPYEDFVATISKMTSLCSDMVGDDNSARSAGDARSTLKRRRRDEPGNVLDEARLQRKVRGRLRLHVREDPCGPAPPHATVVGLPRAPSNPVKLLPFPPPGTFSLSGMAGPDSWEE